MEHCCTAECRKPMSGAFRRIHRCRHVKCGLPREAVDAPQLCSSLLENDGRGTSRNKVGRWNIAEAHRSGLTRSADARANVLRARKLGIDPQQIFAPKVQSPNCPPSVAARCPAGSPSEYLLEPEAADG